MKVFRLRTLSLLCLAVALPAGAIAAPITFQASGTVTGIELTGTSNLFPIPVAVGNDYSFTFTFESTAEDQDPDDAGSYPAPTATWITVNGATYAMLPFATIGPRIHVSPESGGKYEVSVFTDTQFPGQLDSAQLTLSGLQTAFDQTLPLTPPALTDYLNKVFTFIAGTDSGSGAETDRFTGTVTSLQLVTAPVPLPAAAWLLLSGAGALGALARRRRRAG